MEDEESRGRIKGEKRRRLGDEVKRQHKGTMIFYQQMKRGVYLKLKQ